MCKKEKSVPISDYYCGCPDFYNNKSTITTFFQKGDQFKSPFFNPNNSNEFIYNHVNYENGEFKLIKYNIVTNTKTILVNNVIASQPKWNRKGWIVYDNVYQSNNQIWSVKDNGDSLTQIYGNVSSFYPDWDSSGNNLVFLKTTGLGRPYSTLKFNKLNSLIDTFYNEYMGFIDVSNTNNILCKYYDNSETYIGYTKFDSLNFKSLVNIGNNSINCLTWKNNTEFLYSDYHIGIKKGDINKTDTEILIRNTICKIYTILDCSKDEKTLIIERIDKHFEKDSHGNNTNKIIEKSTICTLDLATLKETKINLN
jgi:hypothetical protein